MKIKKGDTVLIISGKSRGKKGKVLKVFSREEMILIEAQNLRKKHVRPKKSGEKGQIVETPAPIHISNVKIICPKCKQPARVGYKIITREKKRIKARICKKCQEEI